MHKQRFVKKNLNGMLIVSCINTFCRNWPFELNDNAEIGSSLPALVTPNGISHRNDDILNLFFADSISDLFIHRKMNE